MLSLESAGATRLAWKKPYDISERERVQSPYIPPQDHLYMQLEVIDILVIISLKELYMKLTGADSLPQCLLPVAVDPFVLEVFAPVYH